MRAEPARARPAASLLLSLAIASAVMATPGACLAAAGAAIAAPVAIGTRLPDARLDGLRVPARALASLRGKPLLINVWASWCGPCRLEMASLDRLARGHGRQLNVIGISTDDERAAALGLLQATQIGFPNYIDANLVLENMLGANRIPLTVLVDAQGRVRARFYGSREWDSAASKALIARALAITL